MRSDGLYRLVSWFEHMARAFWGAFQPSETALVPVRIETTRERELVERHRLLERTLPRMPPPDSRESVSYL